MRVGFHVVTALLLVALIGCTDINVPNPKSTTGRTVSVPEIPEPDETVRGAEDPPIVTLEIGSRLRERRLTRTEDLPGNIIVPNTNLSAVPVTAALQAVLSGSDVSLSWEAGTFDSRLVSVSNLSGSLPKVVEKICASAKVFCSYRNGLLEMKEKETFIIDLPSVPTKNSATGAATNTMAETIGELAGEKARIDTQGGNLIYTADVEGYEHVRQYLDQLRHGRPLVVLQLYIWEVTLDNDKATGINWKSFSFPQFGGTKENVIISGLTGLASVATPGVSIGAKLSGKVNADTVLQFLSTQGQVQTISNPQLTFVSGSNAEFRVGGKQRYISQVGTLTNSVSGSSSSGSSNSSNNTVSTDSIDTGLTVTISGAFESGIISAIMELEIQDIISLNQTTTESGVTLDLPETSERKVSTTLRVRPGDNLVLAGLVTSRDDNSREGIPLPFGKQLSMFRQDKLKNSELVILVKPSVVLFSEAPEAPLPVKKTRASSPSANALTNGPSMDAVMIDKDGAKAINMPSATQAPVSLQAESLAQPKPELMVPAEPAPFVPVSRDEPPASSNGATVDRRLMQRGFSHAFDELQQPSAPYGGTP